MAFTGEYWEYVTVEGDRWDLIAYNFYGDPFAYEGIITANPEVPIIPILQSGLKLKIPVIETTDTISAEELPPWKR